MIAAEPSFVGQQVVDHAGGLRRAEDAMLWIMDCARNQYFACLHLAEPLLSDLSILLRQSSFVCERPGHHDQRLVRK